MSPPIYQYVIKLFVSLPNRRGPGVIMNVSVPENCALKNPNFMWQSFYWSTLIISILM